MNCGFPCKTLEWDEPDPFWEYEQERIAWMAEAFQAVLSETQWHPDQYVETVRRFGEEQLYWINYIFEKLVELQEIIDIKAKVL